MHKPHMHMYMYIYIYIYMYRYIDITSGSTVRGCVLKYRGADNM